MICYREIDAVVPPYKRESLAHHRESLIPGDLLTYQAGLDWIGAMRARIYEMEGLGLDPWDAASWPAVPADLPDLVSRY